MKVKINGKIKNYKTVEFDAENGVVRMIEQNKLPHEFEILGLRNHKEVADAIRTMVVRGAPAIGVSAGYGLAQACIEGRKLKGSEAEFDKYVKKAKDLLESTRPTARDLFYATSRVMNAIHNARNPGEAKDLAISESQQIADECVDACRKIGEYGNELIKDGAKILTHCNAGALATVDHGTALAPMRSARDDGKGIFVLVDETRPRLQGAKLTSWELFNEDIEHAVIVDNAAGYFMHKGEVDLVIVGADRVAKNGDVANKIGTYEKALCAHENNIPFYVAAPFSTVDFNIENGGEIPIEERSKDEVLILKDKSIAPKDVNAKNPAFDVTPARYITGIITEKGVVNPGEIKNFMD
ncbi:MAG: S-methyl-5-thioribose-1-phosphate isomerase [Candidatus Altiarchaeales archaeon WOR_SM1_86-2]|nr:MAG: S-methyl-5-thioribose-1-phosphate isomerase [Candidatus Altiarchaeales archaeon WOR_SM1_86-2]